MKLPILSGKEVITFLSKNGFYYDRQKGSHVLMKKKLDNIILVTVIPMHKKIDAGILISILKQSNLSRKDLENYLK